MEARSHAGTWCKSEGKLSGPQVFVWGGFVRNCHEIVNAERIRVDCHRVSGSK
jgi:hypothetical protein